MIQFFKRLKRTFILLWKIETNLDALRLLIDNQVLRLEGRIDRGVNFIKERTTVDADVGIRGPNTIICIGRYRNNDYVRIFEHDSKDFESFIHQLESMRKYHQIRTVDCPQYLGDFVARVNRVKNGN